MMTTSSLRRVTLLCLALITVCPVAAQETMDAAILRQHIAAAEGSPPASYVEEIETSSSFESSTERSFHRGSDFRAIFDGSIFHTQRGRLNGESWDQNANGLTAIHESEPGNERRPAYKTEVTRVNTPFDAWRISVLDRNGFGSIRYVDPSSYHLLRLENLSRYGTVRTDYDDYRTIDGYTIARHWKYNDERSRIQGESRIVKLEPREVTDADLAIPQSKSFVEFPVGRDAVELPAKFVGEDVIVRIMIGDRGLDFVLDTGAGGMFIDTEAAKSLGLRMSSKYSAVAGGRYDSQEVVIPQIRVGDLTMRNVAATTIPYGNDFGPYWKTKLVGLLGYDFIKSVGLIIDYRRQRLFAVPAGTLAHTITPQADIIPIRLGDHVPEMTAIINGATAERLAIDTGASGGMILFDYFTLRYPEALSPSVASRIQERALTRAGIGGNFESLGYRLATVDFGPYHMTDVEALHVISSRKFQFEEDGVVGGGILKQFTVGFDYTAGKMYLVRNEGE